MTEQQHGRLLQRSDSAWLKPAFPGGDCYLYHGMLWKVYDSPVALTGGGPGTTTMMPSMYMYNTAFNYAQFGYGSVLAVIILIECAIFTFVVGRIFKTKDGE